MFGDVLCLSHLRWGFVYQRPNHLMSRCARERRVFFVEEPHYDTDRPRIDVQHVENGLYVCVPHLPWGPSDVVEGHQRAMLASLVDRMNVRDPLLWLYTPMALPLARDVGTAGIVYDCMDELSHFDGAPPELITREREVFRVADMVFTGGQSLYEAKRGQHPHVHAFPSSVDFAHFEQARRPGEDPPDQAALARPRLGFFGVVDERMDVALVEAVARARPAYEIVIVGPVMKIDATQLPQLPNLHWLGAKDYASLPTYIRGWDVALMPFALNDATKFISPTKTLEYLAGGKPVVSTSIRDVVRPYGEQRLVRIADGTEAFVAAIDAALAERGTAAEAEHRKARDAFLAGTSWDQTWHRMSTLLEGIGTTGERSSRKRTARKEEETPCSTT